VLLILLLIFFLCGIIGLVLFFIYRFRRNRQGNDQSLLDRVGSEESNNSEISTNLGTEQSEIGKSRRGGRVMNQLDPDAL
jgi:cytoskeletal protein RodZ